MQSKVKKYAVGILGVALILIVWELVARIVDFEMIIPTVGSTLRELLTLFTEGSFYLTVLLSLGRIILGLLIGVAIGMALALMTNYIPYSREIIAPLISIIRSTPVASFIMVLWLLIGSAKVPTVIAVLMVTPIIWQNLEMGFSSVGKELNEVCEIFEIKGIKKLRILVLPTIRKYLIPSIITSAGLSWKSGIAAEIISYTQNSIGREIYDAKSYFLSDRMFAWTIIVIISSLIIEKTLSLISKEVGKNER